MFGGCPTESRASKYIAAKDRAEAAINEYCRTENGDGFRASLLTVPVVIAAYQGLLFSLSLRLHPEALPPGLNPSELEGKYQVAETVLGMPLPDDCYLDLEDLV